ncbi:MAG TPA: polysaccharide deacetylase family protein [Clostridia bacterium]|nr:polysaccharide deacetylase family protein [Clostridia bacterium]
MIKINQYRLFLFPIFLFLIFSLLTAAGCRIERKGEQPAPAPQSKPEQQNNLTVPPQLQGLELQGGSESTSRKISKDVVIDYSAKYPKMVYLSGSKRTNKIALTFDDAPDNVYTPQILDILKQYNVKATFFVIGKTAQNYPDIMKRIVEEGHVIGNHSFNHANIAKLSPAEFAQDLDLAEQTIFNLTGIKTAFYRSPYGVLSDEIVKILDDKGYKIVAWSVDSLDWKGLTAEQVEANIFSNVTKGSIILQHSAGGPEEDLSGTVKALPKIIEKLQQQGYQFVTVDKLLNLPAEKK